MRSDRASRYHYLNHYSLFGGAYRSGAVSIMSKLLRKYGYVFCHPQVNLTVSLLKQGREVSIGYRFPAPYFLLRLAR